MEENSSFSNFNNNFSEPEFLEEIDEVSNDNVTPILNNNISSQENNVYNQNNSVLQEDNNVDTSYEFINESVVNSEQDINVSNVINYENASNDFFAQNNLSKDNNFLSNTDSKNDILLDNVESNDEKKSIVESNNESFSSNNEKKIRILKYEINYEDGILILIGIIILFAVIFMPRVLNRF